MLLLVMILHERNLLVRARESKLQDAAGRTGQATADIRLPADGTVSSSVPQSAWSGLALVYQCSQGSPLRVSSDPRPCSQGATLRWRPPSGNEQRLRQLHVASIRTNTYVFLRSVSSHPTDRITISPKVLGGSADLLSWRCDYASRFVDSRRAISPHVQRAPAILLENQAAAIQRYVESKGFAVVPTYSDVAKSGVVLRRRSGLGQQLLSAIHSIAVSPRTDQLRKLLVRWLRF